MSLLRPILRRLALLALAAASVASAAPAGPVAPGRYQFLPLHIEPPRSLATLFEPFHPLHLGVLDPRTFREISFELFPQAGGSYVIRGANGDCATVARGVLIGSPRIDMLPCETPQNATSRCQMGADDQRFNLRAVAPGLYKVQTSEGQCWDVRDASRDPGADVLAHECHGGANQRFRLAEISPATHRDFRYSPLFDHCARERQEAAAAASAPPPSARPVTAPVAQPGTTTVFVGGAAAPAVPRARQPFQPDMDRPGNDLPDGRFIDFADPAACDFSCNNHKQCRAWVFVKPGVQGPQSVCYLKSAVTPAVPNVCCVTGLK